MKKKKVFLYVAAVLFIAVYLVISTVVRRREKHQAVLCDNNLKIIGIALLNYHDIYRTLPPAYIADENGKPMHSWRVLLLPMLGEDELYRQYDFGEPWDGPSNKKLHDKMPKVFRCPSDDHDHGNRLTNYIAILGKNTAWPFANSLKLSNITDKSSRTILLAEMKNSGINWLEPRDLEFDKMSFKTNDLSEQSISSNHDSHFSMLPFWRNTRNRNPRVLMVDQSVRPIPFDISKDTLKALITINGGEVFENWFDWPGKLLDKP